MNLLAFRALAIILLSAPLRGQDPAAPISPTGPNTLPADTPPPLVANPARDLYDFATLHYNSAIAEKDAATKKQSFQSAAKTFDRFLRKFPKDPKAIDAWFFLAQSYRQLGEVQGSRACFETIAKNWKTGKYVEASALYLAKDDFTAKKWNSAAKWFQIVANTTNNKQIKHEALYRRVLCYQKTGDKSSQLLALKTVIETPGSPYLESARLTLARLYQNTHSHRQAHDLYVLLAESKKEDIRAEATFQAALTAEKMKAPLLTKKWFRKVLAEPKLKDSHGQTQLALMNLEYKTRDWAAVIRTYKVGNFTLEKESELQKLIMAAKSYEKLGKEKEVITLYQKITKLNPNAVSSFDAAYRLVVDSHTKKAKDFTKNAENFLSNYSIDHQEDPKIHSIYLLLAEHYYAEKQHQKALTHYQALDITKIEKANHFGVRYHIAKTLLALKSDRGSLTAIDTFIKEYPDTPQATQLRLDRAELLQTMDRPDKALDDYRAILKTTQDPELKRVLLLRLASSAKEAKNWDLFANYQKQILSLPKLDKKTKASANFWLGWNEYRLKQNLKAEPYLRTARDLDPRIYSAKVGPLLIRSAYQNENKGVLEKEINLLKKHSPETKIPSSIPRWLGASLAQDGKNQRAYKFLHDGLKDLKNPAPPLIWKLYTQTSLKTKHYKSALHGANVILELQQNRYRRAEALHLKAQALLNLKRFNDARQAASDAVKLRPQGDLSLKLRFIAGDIDIAEGKPADAIKHYAIIESLYAKTPAEKKEALSKVISTLKAINTPEARETLKQYQQQ